MKPFAVLEFAKSLEFMPEIRTKTYTKDRVTQVGLYALYHEQRDPNSGLTADFLEAELKALWTHVSPITAVNFSHNLKQGRLTAAQS